MPSASTFARRDDTKPSLSDDARRRRNAKRRARRDSRIPVTTKAVPTPAPTLPLPTEEQLKWPQEDFLSSPRGGKELKMLRCFGRMRVLLLVHSAAGGIGYWKSAFNDPLVEGAADLKKSPFSSPSSLTASRSMMQGDMDKYQNILVSNATYYVLNRDEIDPENRAGGRFFDWDTPPAAKAKLREMAEKGVREVSIRGNYIRRIYMGAEVPLDSHMLLSLSGVENPGKFLEHEKRVNQGMTHMDAVRILCDIEQRNIKKKANSLRRVENLLYTRIARDNEETLKAAARSRSSRSSRVVKMGMPLPPGVRDDSLLISDGNAVYAKNYQETIRPRPSNPNNEIVRKENCLGIFKMKMMDNDDDGEAGGEEKRHSKDNDNSHYYYFMSDDDEKNADVTRSRAVAAAAAHPRRGKGGGGRRMKSVYNDVDLAPGESSEVETARVLRKKVEALEDVASDQLVGDVPNVPDNDGNTGYIDPATGEKHDYKPLTWQEMNFSPMYATADLCIYPHVSTGALDDGKAASLDTKQITAVI
eukprot:jgi/Bigna1/73458/fgenesh1_pg.24_\